MTLVLPGWRELELKRQIGWEARYIETLERHMAAPLEYGVSDCITIPADIAEAMCGKNPLPKKVRTYKDDSSALRMMAKYGFKTIEDLLERIFPEINKQQVRRGDCGTFEQSVDGKNQLTCVIVVGPVAIGRGKDGQVCIPIDRLRKTYAIGGL